MCRFARPQCVHIIGALYTSRVCFVGGGGGKRESKRRERVRDTWWLERWGVYIYMGG